MKYSNNKDHFLRLKYKKYNINKMYYNFIKLNNNNYYFKLMLYMQKIYKYEDFNNKLVNRCFISKRSRAVYRMLNLSKTSAKQNMSDGFVNGFRKSAW